MTEKLIEKRLREEVKKRGGIAVKFFCPSFTGLPDRIVILPGNDISFVELKSPGKSPSRRQRIVLRLLERLGVQVYVIDSMNGLELFFDERK